MKHKNSWTNWAGMTVLGLGLLGMLILGPATVSAAAKTSTASPQADSKYEAGLVKQVHHALAMLPWYGVFDDLAYSVNGTQVTLTGDVVNPATKDAAVASVKHIEGVTSVVDQINVLPPSSMDSQIRRAEYRAIFSYAGLNRYAMGVNPSIHIIVDNGHVTLIGYVDNQADAKLAYMRASSVPGVFSVTNKLQVG
ncbi:MAG: BON domain-containing protein [Candidatus Acidiferrales bacterium]